MVYDNAIVKSNIQYFLKSRSMTIGEFEDVVNVSRGYVSRTLKGSSYPGIEFLISTARLFNITLDSLLFRDWSSPTPQETKILNFVDRLIEQTSNTSLEWKSSENDNKLLSWACHMLDGAQLIFICDPLTDSYVLSIRVKKRIRSENACNQATVCQAKKGDDSLFSAKLELLYHLIKDENARLSKEAAAVIDFFLGES